MVNDELEIGATDFKARCLDLLKQVQQRKHGSILITRRGKPLARVVPVGLVKKPFYGCMKGRIQVHGDLTEPTGGDWEALEG